VIAAIRRPTLLSFDVFGTLVDSRGGSRDAFEAILHAAGGAHVDPMEFQDHWELANIRRYREPYRSYKLICRDSLFETFAHFGVGGDPGLIQLYFDAYPSSARFPDVDAVLDRLAQRHRLAVVSNIDDDLLAATPLGRRFDLVCTAERASGYKPDGTLFRHLLREGGVDVSELLHSGQSQRTDMVGAKPLGITVAWINRRGLTLAPEVPEPDYEFRDLRPLLDLVDVG
jgi:2-haloalkanoic acid dehalogenase type II